MFSETAELYDLFYEWKDYAAEAAKIRAIVDERAPGARTLLDVACGTGRHLERLRDGFDAVEGVDLDEGLVRVARGRLLDVPIHVADMRSFRLERQFDVVTSLFSSIGYVETLDGLRAAVASMAIHVAANGVLIIEPWFGPEGFDPTHPSRPAVVEAPGLQAVRLNGSRVEGRRNTLEFHYLVRRGAGIEHLVEEHAMGLFTDDEYRDAFLAAGMAVEHDRDGLMGRGLWIARHAA
jgi:SAM-dependent methyltransferase